MKQKNKEEDVALSFNNKRYIQKFIKLGMTEELATELVKNLVKDKSNIRRIYKVIKNTNKNINKFHDKNSDIY